MVLPFHRLRYDTPDHAVGYAMHFSRSADAVIRVYNAAGNVNRMPQRLQITKLTFAGSEKWHNASLKY